MFSSYCVAAVVQLKIRIDIFNSGQAKISDPTLTLIVNCVNGCYLRIYYAA